jgi:5'-3' exonuclease
VGAKTAATLLGRYGTLEQVLADGRFAEQAEALRLYKRIATMDASAPLPALDDRTPTWSAAGALAQKWELRRLADRLEG